MQAARADAKGDEPLPKAEQSTIFLHSKTVFMLTNKERANCYLNAAIAIKDAFAPFCCTQVAAQYCKTTGSYLHDSETELAPLSPELFLFKPDVLPDDLITVRGGWWSGFMRECSEDVRNEKIMVLLFAHAIALNP